MDIAGTGNAAANTLLGNAGANLFRRGAGNDTILAGAGNDLAFGEAGDDSLGGGEGADQLSGGEGADRLAGGAGDDLPQGEAGEDALDGGEGVHRLFGGEGADTLAAGAGPDALRGEDGDDRLSGGPDIAFDLLLGGAGNDTPDGAGGLGEAGADIFLFRPGSGTVVGDFLPGPDRLCLAGFGLAFPVLQARWVVAEGGLAVDLGEGDPVVLSGVAGLSPGDVLFA
ncbi:calcium-binding protein [Siccirubricoccus phaeus]|uniref:calcium-binding protein n=1 Tax=Siccirubricoccus phaeus TaxID=2595053 RepID=UPI00165C17FE|nr:calcium-binding protein [Siccirubricoccus phaeus]